MVDPLLWLNPSSFLLLLLVGYLAGGKRIGLRSRKTPLSPPDWAFSIWFVIYSLLSVFCVAQGLRDDIRSSVGVWFVAFCVLASAWTVCFSLLPRPSSSSRLLLLGWSLLPFLLIASSAAFSLLCLVFSSSLERRGGGDWLLLFTRASFSLLSGWLVVATSLSLLQALAELRGGGDSPPFDLSSPSSTLVSVVGWIFLLVFASLLQTSPFGGWNPVLVLPFLWASLSVLVKEWVEGGCERMRPSLLVPLLSSSSFLCLSIVAEVASFLEHRG